MRYIVTLIFLLTCKVPQPLYSSDPAIDKAAVVNRIKIRGDSNHVEINYYWYRNDTVKRIIKDKKL